MQVSSFITRKFYNSRECQNDDFFGFKTKFDYLLTLRIKVKSFLSFLLTFVCSLGTIVSSMKVLIKLLAAWITYIFIHEIMNQNSLTFYSQNKRLD